MKFDVCRFQESSGKLPRTGLKFRHGKRGSERKAKNRARYPSQELLLTVTETPGKTSRIKRANQKKSKKEAEEQTSSNQKELRISSPWWMLVRAEASKGQAKARLIART